MSEFSEGFLETSCYVNGLSYSSLDLFLMETDAMPPDMRDEKKEFLSTKGDSIFDVPAGT